MTTQKTTMLIIAALAVAAIAYFAFTQVAAEPTPSETSDAAPQSQEQSPASGNAKINIDAVCEGALAYMSFPDGASAEAFVAECKAGEHPEVIEQYKAKMDLGDGAAI